MAIDQEEDSVNVGRDMSLEYNVAINHLLSDIKVPVQTCMVLSFVGPTVNFRMGIAPIADDEISPSDDDDDDYDYDYEDTAEFDDEDWEPKFEPANRVSIEELERVKVEEGLKEEAGSCSVCFDDFETGSEATRMPCSHLFHGNCIVNWLQNSKLCPLCRFQMPS